MPDLRPDLRIVLLTPPGRGAIATIRVEGRQAFEAVEERFRPVGTVGLRDAGPERPLFGRFGPDPAEEVVLRCTGGVQVAGSAVEIHCHGGHAAVARIVAILEAAGAQTIGWEQWARLHDEDPLKTAAQIALGAARTRKSAAILLDQHHGALRRAIDDVLRSLAGNDLSRAVQRLRDLLKWAPLGLHLVQPWRVVVAGAPNVGKSSLINALLGYARAIVHPAPGTTRDLVTAETIVAGWPVQLIDTAGLRDAQDPLEQAGIERAGRESASADLVILVFDLSRPWSPHDEELCRQWPAALVVHNKADLPGRRARETRHVPAPGHDEPSPEGDLPAGALHASYETSAATGEGMESLLEAIAARLVPELPAPGTAVPFQPDQVAALEAAETAIQHNHAASAIETLQRLTSETHRA